MKFLHTADLQIGACFAQFGAQADILRKARLRTLGRVLDIAADRGVDAVLVAGDLFESNQVSNSLAQEAFRLFEARPDVHVVILPGNHDPLSGPASVWSRKPFSEPPPHLTVCTSSIPVQLRDAVILPVPITQKNSTKDPSLPLVEMAANAPAGKIRVGIAHGALAIEGKHQPNDHPIALNAATRAGLDYLAVGHWHKAQVYDNGRLVMPGTPEPDQFDQGPGTVTLVEIAAPGSPPKLETIESAELVWHVVALDLATAEATPEAVDSILNALVSSPDRTVLRFDLKGPVSPDRRAALLKRIEQRTALYAVVKIGDMMTTVLSGPLRQAWLGEHPLLAQVAADVERIRAFVSGETLAGGEDDLEKLTFDEFQSLCSDAKIDPHDLDGDAVETMMRLLTAEVAEVASKGGDA